MKKYYILLVAITLCFASCWGVSEYAYNEKAASLYWDMSKYFEEVNKELVDGKLLTKYDFDKSNSSEYAKNEIERDIKNLRSSAKSNQEDLNLLEPSSDAKDFHAKLNEYFDAIENDYVNELQAYASIDCDCPEQKDSVLKVIARTYEGISNIENQMLEVQKIYFEKVGLKPNENK